MLENKTLPEIVIKKVTNLSESELLQIKEAEFREFKVVFEVSDQTKDRLFFLLKQGDKILAMGALTEVKPVIFNGTNFVIYSVLNVVSNIKGKGYGKKVVTAMREYLISRNKSVLGFCMPKNSRFYKKCGFSIDTISTQRFVYKKGDERTTNKDGQYIFYQDSEDRFMKKVLAVPNQEVSIPTADLW